MNQSACADHNASAAELTVAARLKIRPNADPGALLTPPQLLLACRQEGRRLNMDELTVLRARAFVRGSDEERRPQDVMALVRQKQIRGAYAEAAVA